MQQFRPRIDGKCEERVGGNGCEVAKSERSGRSIKLLELSRLLMRDGEKKSDKLVTTVQKGRSLHY